MPIINLTTVIKSKLKICFNLSRSIDLHKISTTHTNEVAIDGCTKGLIGLNEFVTWQATHFGIRQKLSSKITILKSPFHFRDEQIKGIFKFMVHDHYFEEKDGIVIMSDIFEFQSPLGFLGILFEKLVLIKYLKELLIRRNRVIKEYAESDKWKLILNDK
jgi:ligand-binding SRPBCC domain-containing protein